MSEGIKSARREEIVDACARLYDKIPYKEITLLRIGEETSFSRPSIYNYFNSREEIFLALLEREYLSWTEDLNALPACKDADAFADAFACALEKRGRMLKLLATNLYDLEAGSGEAALIRFKRAYGAALQATRDCLSRSFPSLKDGDKDSFLYAVYPFMFGVYPYTAVTDKQKRAMDAAGVSYPAYSVRDITRALAIALLRWFQLDRRG